VINGLRLLDEGWAGRGEGSGEGRRFATDTVRMCWDGMRMALLHWV
jgi:hypothetical protein